MLRSILLASVLVLTCAHSDLAAEEPDNPLSVKDLAAKVKSSIVVISQSGRDSSQAGLGTGFVIDKAAGLIATNLHVIGEARPISVQTAEGKSLTVKAVHASDRALDLAIIQVEATICRRWSWAIRRCSPRGSRSSSWAIRRG